MPHAPCRAAALAAVWTLVSLVGCHEPPSAPSDVSDAAPEQESSTALAEQAPPATVTSGGAPAVAPPATPTPPLAAAPPATPVPASTGEARTGAPVARDAKVQGLLGAKREVGEVVGLGGLGTRGSGKGQGSSSAYGAGGGSPGFGAKGKSSGVGYGAGAGSYAGEAVPIVHGAPMTGDSYDALGENPFHTVADAPLSTFSIDVDTASYTNVRRHLQDGTAPPKSAVRIEELLNFFTYDDAPPTGDAPFAAHTEVTSCPWAPGHQLVRIGLKGREVAAGGAPPRNLVFLVDVSGSMSGPDRLPLVVRGLELLVTQLNARDRVSLVVYAGAAGVVLEPTAGDRTEVLREALGRLRSGGSTAGGAGIRAAYALARKHFDPAGINRVILATDGDFNVGTTSEGELVELIEQERSSGVFLTVLGVGRGNLQDDRLEALADKGNGQYAYIDSYAEARRVLGEQIGGTLVTIAKDVKIQVEMNPAKVSGYRLIGYENRVLAARDFNDDQKDAGEIGAGHHVTALYEIVPATVPLAPEVDPLRYQGGRVKVSASEELLTLKLRYKAPDGDTSSLLTFPVLDRGTPFAQASTDARWSAAVAGFGMLLRASPHRGDATWAWVADTAREATGRDAGGYRAEMVRLVELARGLAGGGSG